MSGGTAASARRRFSTLVDLRTETQAAVAEPDDDSDTRLDGRSLDFSARGPFRDRGLNIVAGLMARAHPAAIDYLEQAPVLVLAATHEIAPADVSRADFILMRFAERCEQRLRLRAMMAAYGVGFQLRALAEAAIGPMFWGVVRDLGHLHPSLVAQAMPKTPEQQDVWLRALVVWSGHMRHHFGDATLALDWAVTVLGGIAEEEASGITDIADFVGNNPERFQQRWTFAQARAATERWHAELARASDEREFIRHHGIGFTQAVSYGSLPLAAAFSGFEFVALRSGEDLFIEGREMRHCVATYAARMVNGASRLYSIRLAGQRVATLELERDGFDYRPVQLKGVCNSDPSDLVVAAVDEFAASLGVRDVRRSGPLAQPYDLQSVMRSAERFHRRS